MILTWLKSLALVSLIVFLGFSSYFVWTVTQTEKSLVKQASATFTAANAAIANVNTATAQIGSAFSSAAASVSQTEKDVRQTTVQLNGVVSGLQKTVSKINAPCVPGPCGTVADVAKTLNTTRLSLGQIEIAANSFDQNQDRFYQQEDLLFADSDGAVKHFDTLVSSPDLTGTIHNTNMITSNLGQTTGDFQKKFHDYLYPPPCKGFRCFLKTGFETIKIGSELVEPTYYGWALLKGATP